MLIPDWWARGQTGWKPANEPPKAEKPVLIKAVQIHPFKGTTPHFAEGVWTGEEWMANLLGFERQRISTWEVIGWMEIPL